MHVYPFNRSSSHQLSIDEVVIGEPLYHSGGGGRRGCWFVPLLVEDSGDVSGMTMLGNDFVTFNVTELKYAATRFTREHADHLAYVYGQRLACEL